MRKIFYITAFIVITLQGFAQTDTTNLVKYTPDFKFEDGIYLNFEQVKNNNPIAKSRILTDVGYNDPEFFDRVLQNKTFLFYDEFGIKQEIVVNNIWGYSRNGVLYIGINNGYYRITIIGSICHFVANLTTYTTTYNMSPGYYSYYDSYPYSSRPVRQPTTELRQYLLDFKTGKVIDYNEINVELLLMNDPELYDEFNALKKKKKKQLKYLYIRKYNERNPLYFSAK